MRPIRLHIKNYRGLMDVEIPLSSFVCITGENNAGKSSALQALSLFLSGSALKDSDYFDPSLDVTISLTLTDVTDSDLALLAEEHRSRIAPLRNNDFITFVRRYGQERKSEFGYHGLVPKDPRFRTENVARILEKKQGSALRDFVLTEFPELASQIPPVTNQTFCRNMIRDLGDRLPLEEKEVRFAVLPTGFDRSVLPMFPERIYIPAVKDLSDDTKTTETSSFGKILAIVTKAIEPLLENEKSLFDKLSKKLTRLIGEEEEDERLEEIKNIETTIQKYVQESFSNVKLEIEIPPPEIKSVLSTARIVVDDGMRSPLELKGDGLRRAVVFSILRTYVELSRSTLKHTATSDVPERKYLLLFEEPELFLHPDAQRILFEALGVFSRQNFVVVTTHSPLFLGPDSTATFIRLSKTKKIGITKPFTKACPIELHGMNSKDEFQIICYENNSAAFFARRIVLVEGDTDYIVFTHIAEKLNESWNCRATSTSFVKVGGKGSINRYKKFFTKFDVPLYIITDLDALDDEFDKLDPSDRAKELRDILIQKIDLFNGKNEHTAQVKNDALKKAHASMELRRLWEDICSSRRTYEADNSKFLELDRSVTAFFAWEKKNTRRECMQKAEGNEIKSAKLALIWELRKQGVFVLERGALEDYYPSYVVGDKTTRAQAFRKGHSTREELIALCPQQTCPVTGATKSEFEFIFSSIFV